MSAKAVVCAAVALASLSLPRAAIALGGYQGALAAAMTAPRRLCTDASGNVFAVDARGGGLLLLTAKGELKGRADLGEAATAVAMSPGGLLVATGSGRLLSVDPYTAKPKGEIALADGPLRGAAGLAYEPTRMQVWVAERAANRVRVIQLDGKTAFTVASAAGAALDTPVDVAIDTAGSRVWVVLESGKTSAQPSPASGMVAHAFDLDGAYKTSAVAGGASAGQITRAGGAVADAAGQLYVSDVFQGQVQVYTAAGTWRGALGTFGSGTGQLRTPLGLGLLQNGNVLVANLGSGRIERFGTESALPACRGDSDCDGLPDAWEIAHGLNPNFAGDALADLDGDGLSNAQEYALGTDPSKRDTDGDGFDDLAEVLSGFDPKDPNDHKPRLAAKGPAESGPGLVRLDASVVGGTAACAVSWSQTAGPEKVDLRGAPGLTPSFIARTPGTYAFEARATCGGAVSDPAAVRTAIRDVPPLVDAGSIQVVRPSTPVVLDASASSDANRQTLAFGWEQIFGQALVAGGTGPLLPVQTRGPGYYVFAVSARDAGHHVTVAEVPVLVAAGATATIVATSPLQAVIGSPVLLDASGSFVPGEDSIFVWEQVDGPAATLQSSGGAFAQFTPAAPGRYAFNASIVDGGRRSPPGRIDVYVAGFAGGLPVAAIAPVAGAKVRAALTLDGSASTTASGAIAYAWRQVAGPAAGMDDETSAKPTVVPFGAGSHEFELVVRDGAAESLPTRVRFDVAGGTSLPVAVAAASTTRDHGGVVVLDGTGSRGAHRFLWTQVGGPWVALEDAASATPSFRPPAPGRYVFQLVVEGGGARSAPTSVTVTVGGGRK